MLMRTCHVFQIDVRQIIRRVMLMLVSSNTALLDRVLLRSKIPFNVLEPCAPYLRAHLESLLLSTRFLPPHEARLRIVTDYAFDGVHLTLVGFAAALDAEKKHEYTANVPREGTFILTSPQRRVLTSSDGGANLTTEDRGAQFDPEDGVWAPSVALNTLYSRWPHLLRIFRAATSAEHAAARTFLRNELACESAELPQVLVQLYFQFLQEGGEPVSMWVHRPSSGNAMQMAGQTDAFLQLVGFTQADLVRYIWTDADADPFNAIQWMHPTTIQRRALAALTAANNQLACHSFEGVHMRKVSGERWTRASRAAHQVAHESMSSASHTQGPDHNARLNSQSRHVYGATGASRVRSRDSDDHDQELSVSPQPSSTFYVPFYAVQTQHTEKFPNGCKSIDVLYLSDIVHCRQPQPVHCVQTALGEVEALQMLLQDVQTSSAAGSASAAHAQRPQLQHSARMDTTDDEPHTRTDQVRAKLHSGLPPEIQRLLAMSEDAGIGTSKDAALSQDAHHSTLRKLLNIPESSQVQPGGRRSGHSTHDGGVRAGSNWACARAEVTAAVRRTGSRHGALTSALSTLDSDTSHRLLKRLVMILCQDTDPLLQCKLRLHEPPSPLSPEYLRSIDSAHAASDSAFDLTMSSAAAAADEPAAAPAGAEAPCGAQQISSQYRRLWHGMPARTPITDGNCSPISTLKHEISLESARVGLSAQEIALRCFAPALNGLTRDLLRQALAEAKQTLGMKALCQAQEGLIDLATHEPETLVFAWGRYTATHTYPWVSLRLAAQRWLFPPKGRTSPAAAAAGDSTSSARAGRAHTEFDGTSHVPPLQVGDAEGNSDAPTVPDAVQRSLRSAANPQHVVDSLQPTVQRSRSRSPPPQLRRAPAAPGQEQSKQVRGGGGDGVQQDVPSGSSPPRTSKLMAAYLAQRSAVQEKANFDKMQAARRGSGDSSGSDGSEFSASLERAVEGAVNAAYSGPDEPPLEPEQGGGGDRQTMHPKSKMEPPASSAHTSPAAASAAGDDSSDLGADQAGDVSSNCSECSDCHQEGEASWAQWPPNTCGPEGQTATD